MSFCVAVEVDFLLLHALGEGSAIDALKLVFKVKGSALVSPSVLQELAYEYQNQMDEALRGPPGLALRAIKSLGICAPQLTTDQHAIAEATARKMVSRGLCRSHQAALILSEAAVLGCPLLLTYRVYEFTQDHAALKLLFLECDIDDCIPLPPLWFTEHFIAAEEEGAGEGQGI